MTNTPVIALILDESKWFTVSLTVAICAVAVLLIRHSRVPVRRRTLAAMNLFFGVTIGAMAFGHLLAVTTKLVTGSLEGSIPILYLIGVALATPAWWVTFHTRRVLASDEDHGPATVRSNGWLAASLLLLGPHNLPLAVPGLLNIAYHRHRRPWVGRMIVSLAAVGGAGLFVGSLVFFVSGQSFEQFRGLR